MIVAGILGGLFSMATLYLIKKFIPPGRVDTNELSVAKYFITTKSKPSGLLLRICKTSACPEPAIFPADK
jgi:hypothetical protein